MIQETPLKPTFHYLNQQTAREVKVSDHEPMIMGNLLVWNIMMQARFNALKQRFNNGFAIPTESQEEYQARLRHIVRVIAEILFFNPTINIIAPQEAPVKEEDINVMIHAFNKQPDLKKFSDSLVLQRFTSMGIATFFNVEKYRAECIEHDKKMLPSQTLIDKFRGYDLQDSHSGERHQFYNMHLPYDLAKKPGGFKLLLPFIKALSHSLDKSLKTYVGDFNFDPKKLLKHLTGFKSFIPKNNNVHLSRDRTPFEETVDGVLTTSTLNSGYRDARNSTFFTRHVSVKPLIERFILDHRDTALNYLQFGYSFK